MTVHPQKERPDPTTTDLTAPRVIRVLLLSTAVWLTVMAYIRMSGPTGAFAPERAVSLYIATFFATIPLNWITRKVAGLPAEKMVSVIAIASIVPPTLEGILMSAYPKTYGGDQIIIGQSAVWLLFAIGVAMLQATLTSLLANKRLRIGDQAPVIDVAGVTGGEVMVPDETGRLTHVQFLRFAGCPVCNLHMQSFMKRKADLDAAAVREVILFHSAARFITDYYGRDKIPFELIADPDRAIYRRYRVETSPFATLSPMAWVGLVKGYRLKKAGAFDSTTFGQPADFLIDGRGRILECHYGNHSSDQWSVDDILKLASERYSTEVKPPVRLVGAAA